MTEEGCFLMFEDIRESVVKMVGYFVIGEAWHREGRDDLAKEAFDKLLGEGDIFDSLVRDEEEYFDAHSRT